LHDVNEKIAEIKGAAFYDKLYKKYFGVNKDKIQVSSLGDCNNCYVVKHGENLGTIANDQLGDKRRYMEIFELNKARIASPHLVYIGTQLNMPVK
jgi:nucleoid-associated protein YgaU